jgi:hypothetical protein
MSAGLSGDSGHAAAVSEETLHSGDRKEKGEQSRVLWRDELPQSRCSKPPLNIVADTHDPMRWNQAESHVAEHKTCARKHVGDGLWREQIEMAGHIKATLPSGS